MQPTDRPKQPSRSPSISGSDCRKSRLRRLSYSVIVYPGLSEIGRFRSEVSLSISRELFHNFTVGLSGYDSYDNRPPTEGVASNDVGATLSIGWTF